MKKYILLIMAALLLFASSFSHAAINNAALIPLYKPDEEIRIEGTSPDWVKTLIMSELRIETSTYGGNFDSAVSVLDHYAEMGVNGLWICPVYERTLGNGYLSFGPQMLDDRITGTTDIEKGFESAKKFVNEAHARNIRIFFDIVIWGIATNSPLVVEHPDWIGNYNSNWGGYNFKHDNADWREWFINQATNLVFLTGIDGFRCDVEPDTTGYALWEEVRRRCYANGRKIAIISEGASTRNGVYDFEQNGVGYINSGDWTTRRESGNYYISNNIVDSVKSGVAIGIPEAEQGRGRFYTYNVCNHDSHNPIVLGNIIRIGYQAILAPFIPMWYIGEEWNNPRRTTSVMYFNRIDWTEKDKEANNIFFEKVKKLIRIRRQYPDIFDFYPANHRDSNICKVNVTGNNLQSYARFKSGRAIIVIPNFTDSSKTFSFIPPYNDMGMDSGSSFKVTDLINDEILLTNLSKSSNISISISGQDLSVLLLQRNDGGFNPFDDSWNNVLLMHCDATNQGYWLTTPDDNSSGREANEPILDKTNAGNFNFDRTTEPTLISGSPKGGSFLHFDGVNDSIYVNPGWSGGDNVICNFSVKWLGLPPAGEYSALVQTVPWRCFIQPGAGKGYISFLMGGSWLVSTKSLDSNTWYDVSFSVISNEAKLIIDGTTNTAEITISDSGSQIMIGYDLYGLDRFLYGDLDEIRVGYLPEPYCLSFIIYYLLLIKRTSKE